MYTKSLSRVLSINGLFLIITVFALSFSLNFGTAHAATYTVGSLVDATDGSCLDGDCNFRDAISAADANAGADTIVFSVSGTITQVSDGPMMGADILSCGGNITFDGVAGTYNGLRLGGSGTIKGCTFTNHSEAAVYIQGSGNTFGGTAAGERNFVLDRGIDISGTSTTVIGNYFGVTSDGSTCDAGPQGVTLASGSSGTVGGDASNERNVISCQSSENILVQNGAGAWTISGNYIGTNSAGTAGIGSGTGIAFQDAATYASAIDIGGNTAGEANMISGLGTGIDIHGTFSSTLDIKGNYIGTNTDGSSAIANSTGVSINGATCGTLGNCVISDNVISGNSGDGINISNASTKWQIENNKIGINNNGDTALANGGDGIEINTGTNNLIGTTDTVAIDGPNVISGNTGNGINIVGSGSSSNTISENYIGFNSAGTAVVANGANGVYCNACGSLTIGNSTASATMNAIVGNTGDGIEISSNAGAIGVYANAIGATNADFGNTGNGIKVSGTPTAVITIGNAYATGGNHIAGNAGRGIHINESGSAAHVIKGNRIGVNQNATGELGNDSDGILVQGSNDNVTIGSATSTEYNIIGGNGISGVTITGVEATIIGNYIGTNPTFANLGNTGAGTLINASATNVTVGYGFSETLTGLAKANYMGFNGGGTDNDVTVDGATTATNSLRGNVFSLAATDSSANMVFNTGTQGGASNSGVSTTLLDNALTLTLAGLADGTKVDWYTLSGSYATTYQGTATTTSGTATLSGSFTVGDKAIYQITIANGTSYPIEQAGSIISNAPTGLADFAITNLNGSLRATWTAASSSIFDHYEIWYGQNQSDVEGRTGTATEWDNADDSALATVTTAATTIVDSAVNLNTAGQNYYAKIWAYSTSGGNATLTTATYNTGASGGSGSGGGAATTQKKEEFFKDSVKKNEEAETQDVQSEKTDSEEKVVVTEDVDTDDDGLTDVKERELGTDPASSDTDSDGIKDGKEVNYYKTNPLNADTDDDGYADRYEILNLKSDPLDPCDPGNVNVTEEGKAKCAMKLEEEKKAEEAKDDEDVALQIDKEKILKLNEDIDKKVREDYEWVKKHFKQLFEMENIKKAYSNSMQVQTIIDSFMEGPELFVRNGEAITIAMAVFDEELFGNEKMRSASTNAPFIEKGFEKGVINSYVNKDFNSKEYITRANVFRLMFRVSGLKLRKEFGKSLYENFAVKSPVFRDISDVHPALGYVLYLQSKGLLSEYSDGNFNAGDYMERAEFVKMMTLFQQEVEKQKSGAVQ